MTDLETRARVYSDRENGDMDALIAYRAYLAGARETARADAEIVKSLMVEHYGLAPMQARKRIADAILAAAGIERSET